MWMRHQVRMPVLTHQRLRLVLMLVGTLPAASALLWWNCCQWCLPVLIKYPDRLTSSQLSLTDPGWIISV